MAHPESLIVRPIGYIRTPFASKAEAPHQPDAASGTEGVIELIEGMNFEQALEDLAGIEKIWLLYWFDRNPNWKPKVLVPRGPRQKRGVFATRSPHRPNPIGLSLVDLVRIDGLKLRVKNVDLLDGTPIFDIKPYLPWIEAHPDAAAGWMDEAAIEQSPCAYNIRYSILASEQLDFLKSFGIDLRPRIERVLSIDPAPHPYKRIKTEDDHFVQSIRGWRMHFTIDADGILVQRIRSGYSIEKFLSEEELADDSAQRAFHVRFHPVN